MFSAVSRPQEGRIMIVTTRGARDAVDALASGVFLTPDENARAYGEVVWSWRRDPGVTPAGVFPPATVARKAAHRGELDISRKAIAQGMSECFRCPVCSCAPFLHFWHTRPRVQRAPGIPCALFFSRGARHLTSHGRGSRRGNAETRPSS